MGVSAQYAERGKTGLLPGSEAMKRNETDAQREARLSAFERDLLPVKKSAPAFTHVDLSELERRVSRTGHGYFEHSARRMFGARFDHSAIVKTTDTLGRDFYYLVESVKYDSDPRQYRTLCVIVEPLHCHSCGAKDSEGRERVNISRATEGDRQRTYRTAAQARTALNAQLNATLKTEGVRYV